MDDGRERRRVQLTWQVPPPALSRVMGVAEFTSAPMPMWSIVLYAPGEAFEADGLAEAALLVSHAPDLLLEGETFEVRFGHGVSAVGRVV